MERILIAGSISNSDFTEILTTFHEADELYIKKYRPYFDSDLQKN